MRNRVAQHDRAQYARADRQLDVSQGLAFTVNLNPHAVPLDRKVMERLGYVDAYAADVIATMACGHACHVFPGKRYEGWELAAPAGQGIEPVRPVRDEIRRRVEHLVEDLVSGRART